MLNKFGTSAKLYLLMAITALSLIGLGLYGGIDLKKMNDNTHTLYVDRVLCMQQLADIRFEYITQILPAAQNVINHSITAFEAIHQVEKAQENINANWHAYKLSYFTPEEAFLVKQTDIIKGEADEANKNLKAALYKKDTIALNSLIQKNANLNPFVARVTRLMNLQAKVGKEIFISNKEIYENTLKRFIFLILISLVISLSLSFFIIKNIRNLIKDVLKSNDTIRESDQRYRNANARFKAIVENVFVGIKLNDADWQIIYRSPSMEAINGWPDDVIARDHFKLIHPDDLEMVNQTHQLVLVSPAKTINCIYRILHKNGNYIWIESTLCNKLADPDLKAIITVTRDITERKQLELEIREAELRFKTLAEKSMVGVYIHQGEKFTYVNPRFAQIFGYKPDDLINTGEKPEDIIISEEFRDMVRNNVRARYLGETEIVNYEVAGKKKDGTIIYVEFYGSRVKINDAAAIIGTMIDITERKKAEELILREKMLSDTIINSLPGVFYLRNDKGGFLRWNKNFETITGYNTREIKQINAQDLIVKEDKKKVATSIEKAFSEGYAAIEAKAIMKGGNQIPFLFSAASIIYENKQCLLGTGFDISSRLKAEEELRSSEQKYKLLFESNPLPMWMVARDDLSIIAVNESAALHYGYTKDELLQMNIKKMRPEEDLAQQWDAFRREINGATDFGIVKHLKKDRSVIFVHIISYDIIFEGRAVRLSLTNDVTEQVKADDLLKKSEANLKAIMDTTDTAYALLDKNLRVVTFNQAASDFVNKQYHHAAANGDKLADFFPANRFPQFTSYAEEVLKGNNISYEANYPQADGSAFWYYVRLFPIKNETNEILGLMLALSDITKRKNGEEDLKVAYERIQNHVASITDMAWKQSHLIRSPLANLKGLIAMLKDDPSDADVLNFVQYELNRMDTIIIEMAEDASRQEIF